MKTERLVSLPRVLFWEFIQNLPFLIGFVLGFRLWARDRWIAAIICLVVGSILGSLVIYATESKIVEGHREPVQVTIANTLVILVSMFVLMLYLSAGWGSWQTDLLAGGVVGLVIGGVQSLAAREPLSISHCVAFASSMALVIICTRVFITTLPTVVAILVLTTILTLAIVLLDYYIK